MTEPTLIQKLLTIKQIVRKEVCKLNYFDFYEEDDPCLVYCFYTSTNENLNYLSKMTSFAGKDVLVPTASGDHVFNSILLGAKSVETFDINSISKYHYDVKENAIKHLSRKQFLDFYSFNNLLNEKTYQKLKPTLKEETKMFFDGMFEILKQQNVKINTLVEDCPTSITQVSMLNPYLKDEESYKILQDKLFTLKTPVRHKVCAMNELNKNFGKKDIIILSNILTSYFGFNYNLKPILQSIIKMLKRDGVASVDYIYGELSKLNKYFLRKTIKKQLDVEDLCIYNESSNKNDLVLIARGE